MKNKLLGNLFSNERKRYNKIIKLFEQKNYEILLEELFDRSGLKNNMYDTFGFSDKRYIDNVLERFTQELDNNEFKELFFKWLENYTFNKDFSNSELFIMGLTWGFVPTLGFLEESKVLRNPKLAEKLLDIYDSEELVKSSVLIGDVEAQRVIIKIRPKLLMAIKEDNPLFEPIWIEAFKQGYFPDGYLVGDGLKKNYILFSKLIKLDPEMIRIADYEIHGPGDYGMNKVEEFSMLALSMGYVPQIGDLGSKFIQNSPKIVQILLQSNPEAIKYINHATADNFKDYARLALDNGYVPTLDDMEQNPEFRTSFDIMKILIAEKPELINKIMNYVSNEEELLEIAIKNGFKGELVESCFNGVENPLFFTDTAIIYLLNRGKKLNEITIHGNEYGEKLYNFLIDRCYELKDYISFFTGSFDVMKKIVYNNPEYINFLSEKLSRREIDSLGLLAIDRGYEPKFEDTIFGYGIETAKIMVRKYPNYLEKVNFDYTLPVDVRNEICKIALDSGFLPNSAFISAYNYCNSNYDIMKKAIPLKPSLIEQCSVEDQIKYDELCNLALSCGYEVESFYDSNSRLYSNYEIMKRIIAKVPVHLRFLKVTDPDKILNLIDMAINFGFSLLTLEKQVLFKFFIQVDESKWPNYLDHNTIVSLKKVRKLWIHNNEIINVLNLDFLADEIVNHFSETQIEILSCYPNLQEKIIELSSKFPFKANLIYELVNRYKDGLEWIPVLEKALYNVNASDYINLFESIKDHDLTQEEKDNLIYLLITDNHLDISSYDELKNIDEVREKYIEKLIKKNTLCSLKLAYFEKVYGISLEKAINLVDLYGKSLGSKAFDSLDEESKSRFALLQNMKKIIDINNVEVLKYYLEHINPNFVVKPDLMVTYEAKLKNLFTQEFNKSLTKPVEEDRVISEVKGEQDLDIYLAAGHDGKKKCRMMITSIGAYSAMDEPDDYYASWNINQIASHGCCCSYVGEKNLGTAEVKYCCFGFTDYEPGALQLSGPYDLGSHSSNDSYNIDSYFSSMYLLPDDELDYTRHTHNETVWERRNISGGKVFKKQPSYIVYFVDNFEDRLNDSEAMRQWESVKKAAADFSTVVDGVRKPLPIMVVEREKIAKSQIEIIQGKLNEFKTTFNSKLIKEIVTDYESNYAGNRTYHLNISKKYFPKHEQLADSVVGEIIGVVKKIYSTEPDIALECINELEKVVKNEKEKYDNERHGGVSSSESSFNISAALNEILELKMKFKMSKDSLLTVINNVNGNERQYKQSDVSTMNPETCEIQLSSSDVLKQLEDSGLSTNIVRFENEIKDEKINENLKLNGQRHIKNVVLYSALVGKAVIQNKHDLDLVMVCAKYHDVGRETDVNEPYAKESAKIAAEKLKGTYSSEDLAIIKTIIEFHSLPRNYKLIDESFVNIAKANGIPTEKMDKVREMAEVLKDADALDRTRFINKARLNQNFLKYGISKQLIKFASSLQETYALQDLQDYQCDDIIGELLQGYTPQEVLRTIRHSTRGMTKLEDIQSFIASWATSSIKEIEEAKVNNAAIDVGDIKHGK